MSIFNWWNPLDIMPAIQPKLSNFLSIHFHAIFFPVTLQVPAIVDRAWKSFLEISKDFV